MAGTVTASELAYDRDWPALLPGAIDELRPVTVRILNETQPLAALVNAVRLALGLNPLRLQLGKCAIEVVDSDSDVAITGA